MKKILLILIAITFSKFVCPFLKMVFLIKISQYAKNQTITKNYKKILIYNHGQKNQFANHQL